MNFFVYKTVAERYARYRPYFHPLVIAMVRSTLRLERRVNIALDVGCGSGQSAAALKEIAHFVLGLDISAEMLAVADKSAAHYLQSAAERLPIKDHCCDLLTTFLAFHWFRREQFFAEARRILKGNAWLIISNHWFNGQMNSTPEFAHWFTEIYLKRYPTPPRNSAPLTQAVAQRYGFNFADQQEFQNEIQFRAEELAAYLTTQSNVVSAVEQGTENVQHVYQWITQQVKPFFKTEKALFPFGGYIWYLKHE